MSKIFSTATQTVFKALVTAVLGCLLLNSPAIAQPPAELFATVPVPVAPGPHGISAVEGNLDIRGLALGRRTLLLDLPDGAMINLEMDAIDRRGPADLGWRGHVTNDADSSIVLTLKHGLVFGRLSVGEKVFEVRSRPNGRGRLIVEELDSNSFPACSVEPEFGAGQTFESRTPYAGDGGAAAAAGEEDAGVVIDLLSVYSNGALADLGSVAAIEAFTQAAVDGANAAFSNSNMTARYRLVHVAPVDHDTSGATSADLSWVSSDAGVAALRDQYGADMVSMLVDTPGSCGNAYVQRNPGPGFESAAFQVSDVDCAVGSLTFAHEHGHNLGMEHNLENSSFPDLASYPWSFAEWVNGSFRTVMSYSSPCIDGCQRTSKFSNPDVFHNGLPTGYDGSRDNARTGDLTGPIAAVFRDTVVPIGNGGDTALIALVSTSNDDVEERLSDGAITLNSTDIELGADGSIAQIIGLRFQNLGIPQDATILSAELVFSVAEVDTGATDLVIRAQASDDAPAFTSSAFDVTSRDLTSNATAWSVPAWDAIHLTQSSPDLTTVVQEVIDRSGWNPNNSMVFVISGNGERTAEAYEGGAGWPSKLRVEWDVIGVPEPGARLQLVVGMALLGALHKARARRRIDRHVIV